MLPTFIITQSQLLYEVITMTNDNYTTLSKEEMYLPWRGESYQMMNTNICVVYMKPSISVCFLTMS